MRDVSCETFYASAPLPRSRASDSDLVDAPDLLSFPAESCLNGFATDFKDLPIADFIAGVLTAADLPIEDPIAGA